jgi:hypothetical protein
LTKEFYKQLQQIFLNTTVKNAYKMGDNNVLILLTFHRLHVAI